MYTRDTIPKILPNESFPLGDIKDSLKEQGANGWLNTIEKLDNNQFRARVNLFHAPTATIGYGAGYRTFKAAMLLCGQWDLVQGNNSSLATVGFKVAMTFQNEVHYLPSSNLDLTLQLARMQNSEEQLYRAQDFARAAWYGMSQYPNVYEKFDRLLEHSRIRYRLSPEENREYFQAGMALPYMLSLTTALAESTPEIKGMADRTGKNWNLQTTPFRQFFTDEVELAEDNIIPSDYLERNE
ncbi:MAG: hypothetical protein H6797_04395 [Candidatus Nomurabacteria bacterium]|nr:MAG: hypothetical protein H6797_04395 [Candidatus Nomurabacteria bacterium]